MTLPKFKQVNNDLALKFNNRNVGMISAYRAEHSHEHNEKNHKELHKKLINLGYSVHHSEGGFIENKGKSNEKEVTEPSYLVMSRRKGDDNGKLLGHLMLLGQHYNQDSILHKPHNSEIASFHGTKKGADPDLGEKTDVGKAHWNHDEVKNSPYFTRVNGHKFTFK